MSERGRVLSVAIPVLVLTVSCALRSPTLDHFNEASAGIGGLGGIKTGSEYSDDEARYGGGKAVLWRLSYARCFEKGWGAACIDSPVDFAPHTGLVSLSPVTPQSYSSLLVTPGVRIQGNGLGGGFLPFNYFGVGAGPARFVASRQLLDGTAMTGRRTTTTAAVRGEVGLNLSVTDRLGLRTGLVIQAGGRPAWLDESTGIAPPGERLADERVGGHVVLTVRF